MLSNQQKCELVQSVYFRLALPILNTKRQKSNFLFWKRYATYGFEKLPAKQKTGFIHVWNVQQELFSKHLDRPDLILEFINDPSVNNAFTYAVLSHLLTSTRESSLEVFFYKKTKTGQKMGTLGWLKAYAPEMFQIPVSERGILYKHEADALWKYKLDSKASNLYKMTTLGFAIWGGGYLRLLENSPIFKQYRASFPGNKPVPFVVHKLIYPKGTFKTDQSAIDNNPNITEKDGYVHFQFFPDFQFHSVEPNGKIPVVEIQLLDAKTKRYEIKVISDHAGEYFGQSDASVPPFDGSIKTDPKVLEFARSLGVQYTSTGNDTDDGSSSIVIPGFPSTGVTMPVRPNFYFHNEMTPDQWISLAKQAFPSGTSYKLGGNPNVNPTESDCSSFVQRLFKEADFETTRTTSTMAAKWPEVGIRDIKQGDLLIFRNVNNNIPNHVGIVVYINEKAFKSKWKEYDEALKAGLKPDPLDITDFADDIRMMHNGNQWRKRGFLSTRPDLSMKATAPILEAKDFLALIEYLSKSSYGRLVNTTVHRITAQNPTGPVKDPVLSPVRIEDRLAVYADDEHSVLKSCVEYGYLSREIKLSALDGHPEALPPRDKLQEVFRLKILRDIRYFAEGYVFSHPTDNLEVATKVTKESAFVEDDSYLDRETSSLALEKFIRELFNFGVIRRTSKGVRRQVIVHVEKGTINMSFFENDPVLKRDRRGNYIREQRDPSDKTVRTIGIYEFLLVLLGDEPVSLNALKGSFRDFVFDTIPGFFEIVPTGVIGSKFNCLTPNFLCLNNDQSVNLLGSIILPNDYKIETLWGLRWKMNRKLSHFDQKFKGRRSSAGNPTDQYLADRRKAAQTVHPLGEDFDYPRVFAFVETKGILGVYVPIGKKQVLPASSF